MKPFRFLSLLLTVMICLTVTHCAPVSSLRKTPGSASDDTITAGEALLTPAQQYAGEVLSYMMRVVLGDAGAPEMRQAWKTRGMDAKLELGYITEMMNATERGKFSVMVFDPNILGLSEVLYHYDKNLNQFKGKYIFDSIYPSVELIALRLLLLQKRSRGEKIRMKALIQRESILLNPAIQATEADLRATNLNPREMKLLKEVFESDPMLFRYLRHPFLLRALYNAGFIESDEWVEQARQEVDYQQYKCRHPKKSYGMAAVKIAVLPSLIADFEPGIAHRELNRYGFKPEDTYIQATAGLEKAILAVTQGLVKKNLNRGPVNGSRADTRQWESVWRKIAGEQIAFFHQNQRPFVILPDNADRTIRHICPEADFYIIILGKNVYQSIDFDAKKDIYPAVNRLYLDFLDVKYSQISEEVDQISRFIVSKLKIPEN